MLCICRTYFDIDITKSFVFDRNIPIYNYRNIGNDINKGSPYFNLFYGITNSFESMIIATSNTTSFLSKSYKKEFHKYFYGNFVDTVGINLSLVPNPSLKILLDKGFKPVVLNIYEKLRFFWINNYKNDENSINDKIFSDIDYLLTFVVKHWFNSIINILNQEAANYLDDKKIVQIALFIIVLFIFIFSYFIIWKSYEQSLSLMLQKSFDLIKLIPEEIKYIIVTKLND